MRCLSNPGMIASIILRAQQMAMRKGRVRTAFLLRTVGMVLVSADFVPGMDIGPGLLMPHPNGIVIGNGLKVGANVSFGGGVTAGVKQPDVPAEEDGYPVICDGAIVLAHAVLVGPGPGRTRCAGGRQLRAALRRAGLRRHVRGPRQEGRDPQSGAARLVRGAASRGHRVGRMSAGSIHGSRRGIRSWRPSSWDSLAPHSS